MEKQEKIVSMFDNIAKTYDVANRVLSFGVDKSWRKKGCELAFQHNGSDKLDLIVDVACGTGDMMSFWRQTAENMGIEINSILGVDPSVGMVDVGRKKFPELEFKIASATDIGIENESADIISISYGIRNVVEREEAFREFHKKLKNGGLVVILEFTKDSKGGIFTKLRDFYMTKILPVLGGIISRNREAYSYLPNSIDGFITAEEMENELKRAGFSILENRSFSMGISSLFIAKKDNLDV
jgi:demethylmenaquinone methyltransferase/2-methoxy-6-polyprenyl-1,4-benzoquinol methylase